MTRPVGRPRTKTPKPRASDGRKRVTVGPPGKGKQQLEERVVLGLKPGDPRTAGHIRPLSGGGTDARSNLKIESRAANTTERNKRNPKPSKPNGKPNKK